ncbi:MAG: PH domain-containing protein, partial [Deltaproteobacteria bacterium]|nr:PH domain-containing protein [Deltaproteobacteria bacterium]
DRDQEWLFKEILKPGEEVLKAITDCRIKDIHPAKTHRSPVGVFVATNQRVLFIIPKISKETQIEEYAYDQVTSVGICKTPYWSGCVDFVAGPVKRTVFWINPKSDAEEIVRVIRDRVKALKS